MPPNWHDMDVLSGLGKVMRTAHKSKHTFNPRKSNRLPDLKPVLRKQEIIAFMVLMTLVAIVVFVIGL